MDLYDDNGFGIQSDGDEHKAFIDAFMDTDTRPNLPSRWIVYNADVDLWYEIFQVNGFMIEPNLRLFCISQREDDGFTVTLYSDSVERQVWHDLWFSLFCCSAYCRNLDAQELYRRAIDEWSYEGPRRIGDHEEETE